jgi:type I restriction enzyme S subunit
MSELPEGWTTEKLGAISTKIGSGATPKGGSETYHADGIPLIRSMNIHFDGFKYEGLAFLDEIQAEKLKNVEVAKDDVLLNITGASIGRVTLAPLEMEGARVNQHVAIIRLLDQINPNYIRYFLASPAQQSLIAETESGVTRQALTKGKIEEFTIPLAPLAEQKRIADKLDALLARVDGCRARLARVPAILKRFRQAVLAAATSGALTVDWREGNTLVEDEWTITSVGELIEDIEAGINFQCEERPPAHNEKGLVKISAVTWGNYDDEESKTLPIGKEVPEQTRICEGDFLISRANTLELVGACVIVHKVNRPVYLSDKVLRLVVNDKKLKRWLLYWLRSPQGRNQIESLASGNQLSMRNISQANLKNITSDPTV